MFLSVVNNFFKNILSIPSVHREMFHRIETRKTLMYAYIEKLMILSLSCRTVISFLMLLTSSLYPCEETFTLDAYLH